MEKKKKPLTLKITDKENFVQLKKDVSLIASSSSVIKPSLPANVAKNAFLKKKEKIEEQKINKSEVPEKKTGLFTEKPSKRLTSIKTVDPFADLAKAKINSFAYVYNSGGIPCKIDHHAVNNKLKWNNGVVISELSYDPILVTCFEGLTEEKHPYNFIVPAVIKDMLLEDGSQMKVLQILSKLVWPLRTALLNDNTQVFENSLNTLMLLSDVVGPELNSSLKNLLSPIIKKIDKKQLKDKCFEALRKLESNGGSEVSKIIKTTIPTYSTG